MNSTARVRVTVRDETGKITEELEADLPLGRLGLLHGVTLRYDTQDDPRRAGNARQMTVSRYRTSHLRFWTQGAL